MLRSFGVVGQDDWVHVEGIVEVSRSCQPNLPIAEHVNAIRVQVLVQKFRLAVCQGMLAADYLKSPSVATKGS